MVSSTSPELTFTGSQDTETSPCGSGERSDAVRVRGGSQWPFTAALSPLAHRERDKESVMAQ
jgi:hypothetical protein